MDESATELRKGALDVLILKTLSWGPAHGYAISRWIRETTGGTLKIEEGALYPALHRMEQKLWIESEWGLSETNRRVKSYRLTPAGRRRLRAEASSWSRFTTAMGKVLDATQPPEWVRQT
jgi:PadR family transcriptional regulator, regulatory protein PadR